MIRNTILVKYRHNYDDPYYSTDLRNTTKTIFVCLDAQFLTSYTIRVYPAEVRCGGTTAVIHTFRNIDKVSPTWSLNATVRERLHSEWANNFKWCLWGTLLTWFIYSTRRTQGKAKLALTWVVAISHGLTVCCSIHAWICTTDYSFFSTSTI